jgi:hypothetical protein
MVYTANVGDSRALLAHVTGLVRCIRSLGLRVQGLGVRVSHLHLRAHSQTLSL